MKKQNAKKGMDTGITLIALVVTIIILIILATISINIIVGENGLIAQAERAKGVYEDSADREKNTMEKYSNMMVEPPKPKTGKDLTAQNYGEYVNYGIDLNDDGNYTNDWRIFYVGDVKKTEESPEERRVFIIAADYVPNTCDELQTAKNSNHANMRTSDSPGFKNVSCYWSSAVYNCNDGHNKANNSKPQCAFPYLFKSTGYYCSDHTSSTASKCASTLLCTDNWSSFLDSTSSNGGSKDCGEYAIGGPTVEMWVDSWNGKHGNGKDDKGKTIYANGNSNSDDKSGYCVGETDNCTSYKYSLKSYTGYSDRLYFPHHESSTMTLFNTDIGYETADDGTEAFCSSYWLSSPSGSGSSSILVINCNGDCSGFHYGNNGAGVRPVVCLKTNVKLTKNEEKSTGGRVVYDLSM